MENGQIICNLHVQKYYFYCLICGKIIEFIDDSKKKEEAYQILSGISITQIESKTIIGPLPCSEEMEKYEKVQPGSADRIIGMAEKEQIHRHEMGKSEQPVRHRQLKRGQCFF
ncbi:hypothetical protein ES708_14667 [subsurface metagenome]